MKPKQIVIVTEELDLHTDAAILMLEKKGYEPVRLHTADIPLKSLMSFALNSTDWTGAIEVNGRVIDFSNIRSVWWRRPAPYQLPSQLSNWERLFASKEIKHTLDGLWASLDCYWMSFPHNICLANWKLGQLKRAAKLGFEVPRTLITTEPAQVQAFYEECNGNIIYKVISDPYLAPNVVSYDSEEGLTPLGVYTKLIGKAELAVLDTICLAPCQFQEYVSKQLELRVTVIGDEVFPVEIHSQAHENTRVDWRHYDVEIPYCKATLPVDVAERCLTLVKSYGLNFSAIDLILTPDGRYVFLENNPNGQFLWLEQMVPELRMMEALTACLIRGSNT